MKKALIMIVILGCLAGLVLGGNALLETAYWASDSYSGIPDTSKYAHAMRSAQEDNQEMYQFFYENYASHLTELTDAELTVVQKCKDYVIAYYWDTYGVDLSERIQSAKAYRADFSFLSEYQGDSIGGFYYEDEHILMISDSLLSMPDEFYTPATIIHELVHASGIADDGRSEFITEGFTVAVVERIMNHHGLFFPGTNAYASYQKLANQLLEIDDHIIVEYISDLNFSVIDYIDDMAGKKVGAELESFCMMYSQGTKRDTMEFYMQYYVGDILKQHSEDARGIAEKYPINIFLFGIRSLFA